MKFLNYNIDDTVYILYNNKIRPAKVVGLNINRYDIYYTIEIPHEDGDSIITINLNENNIYKYPVDITFDLREEYESWKKQQKEMEEK